jgi:hypothetical protein
MGAISFARLARPIKPASCAGAAGRAGIGHARQQRPAARRGGDSGPGFAVRQERGGVVDTPLRRRPRILRGVPLRMRRRGMRVNSASAIAAVKAVRAVRDCRVEVYRDGPRGMDSFPLRVVAEQTEGPDALLAGRVKHTIGVTPTGPPAAGIGSESRKARRWVDLRG